MWNYDDTRYICERIRELCYCWANGQEPTYSECCAACGTATYLLKSSIHIFGEQPLWRPALSPASGVSTAFVAAYCYT
jgi:hypothetical protein